MKLIVLIVVGFAATCRAGSNPDEITYLPGLPKQPTFKQYSGYLDTTSPNRHLHYWFVESERDPVNDPVVLWMNGGPGCSSLDGFLTELGPFHVNPDGKTLYYNKFSWNKVANVIFLEAPAGVGFSYTDDGNTTTDDTQTAADNRAALIHFFKKFPQFKKNRFFVTGESYGGIYVPTLAVLLKNQSPDINLKGYAIGNGYLHQQYLDDSLVLFGYFHGLYGLTTWSKLIENCCTNTSHRHVNPLNPPPQCQFSTNPNPVCQEAISEANSFINDPELDVYNLYADCYNDTSSSHRDHKSFNRRTFDRLILAHWSKKTKKPPKPEKEVLPCTDTYALDTYLNQPSVRMALHISPMAAEWTICSSIDYTWQHFDMSPEIKELTDAGIYGMIYNGDVDMACNFLGDQWFVDSLGYPVSLDWRKWHSNGQIAGYIKHFNDFHLLFLTIKGSGHMVPQDKPQPAFDMISKFLFHVKID